VSRLPQPPAGRDREDCTRSPRALPRGLARAGLDAFPGRPGLWEAFQHAVLGRDGWGTPDQLADDLAETARWVLANRPSLLDRTQAREAAEVFARVFLHLGGLGDGEFLDAEEWDAFADPRPLIGHLRNRATDGRLRRFAVACWRHEWAATADDAGRQAADTAERFALGLAGPADLAAARVAAEVSFSPRRHARPGPAGRPGRCPGGSRLSGRRCGCPLPRRRPARPRLPCPRPRPRPGMNPTKEPP
jgi:hypothetical protein